MFHPSVRPKKFKFYIVVDEANKFLVPLATNKTVNDLIEAVKKRLRNKIRINNNLNILFNNNIDSLTTIYWVDAQSLKPKHIYVILQGTDQLQKILNTFKTVLSNNCKLKQFYWFLSRSPSTILNKKNLKPQDISIVPEEIRHKYHRQTPFLYPGFYFNFFIAKKYIGPNHQKKQKEIELYRQQRLQSKYLSNNNSNNSNNNNNNNSNSKSTCINTINDRGRFFTNSAKIEIIHHETSHNQLHFQPNANETCDYKSINSMHNLNKNGKGKDNKNNIGNDDNNININFDNIPTYLRENNTNNNSDSNSDNEQWLYLYHSFDFKYILLLCFVCRCLNRGQLVQSHYIKLQETAKMRQLTDEEFDICVKKSESLNCDHVEETIDVLSKQNDEYYVNFERMIVYECLVHLAADEFEQKRLDILRICSQFGTVSKLTPIEIGCIIQMFQTECQLLTVYRHLF